MLPAVEYMSDWRSHRQIAEHVHAEHDQERGGGKGQVRKELKIKMTKEVPIDVHSSGWAQRGRRRGALTYWKTYWA